MATGKRNSTIIKSTPKESKLLATGVKSIKFWHEATAGETSIPYGSLTLPTAISTSGLSNPTSTDLLNSNLALFHNNVEVHSSLNQKLMEGLTYVVKNNQITFVNGYEATEGEIFEVNYKNDTIVGTNVVDARPIRADGVLTVGQTDFNVGEAFETNKFPNAQIGAVKVYMDGVLQLRNVNNATATPAADGNYEEVHATGGFGVIIRFNDTFGADKVIAVTSEYLAEKPDISQLQLIDSLAGQVDKVIETTAMLAGVPESDFQAAPNNVDLMAFGDKVANLEKIFNVEVDVVSMETVSYSGYTSGTVSGIKYKTLEVNQGNNLLSTDNSGSKTRITLLKDTHFTLTSSSYGSSGGSYHEPQWYNAGGTVLKNLDTALSAVGSASHFGQAGDYFEVYTNRTVIDFEHYTFSVTAINTVKTKIKDLI